MKEKKKRDTVADIPLLFMLHFYQSKVAIIMFFRLEC